MGAKCFCGWTKRVVSPRTSSFLPKKRLFPQLVLRKLYLCWTWMAFVQCQVESAAAGPG